MTQIQTHLLAVISVRDLCNFMWEYKTGKFFDKEAFLFNYKNWIISRKAKCKANLVIENEQELVEQIWPVIFDGESKVFYNDLRNSVKAWIINYVNDNY